MVISGIFVAILVAACVLGWVFAIRLRIKLHRAYCLARDCRGNLTKFKEWYAVHTVNTAVVSQNEKYKHKYITGWDVDEQKLVVLRLTFWQYKSGITAAKNNSRDIPYCYPGPDMKSMD